MKEKGKILYEIFFELSLLKILVNLVVWVHLLSVLPQENQLKEEQGN